MPFNPALTWLTTAQEISLSDILDIPLTITGFTVTDNIGSTRNALTTTPSALIWPEIELFLIAQTDAGWQAKLLARIARWDALDTTVTKIEGGAVGEITSISNDPEKERALIQDKVRKQVPFWTRWVYLQAQERNGGSSVEFVR